MKRCYILSNKRAFFFRFTNSAFGSKWCGLWFPSTKVLDYLAFRIDGEWLGGHNFKKFSLENGTAEHTYKLGSLVIKERLTVPFGLQGMIDLLHIENRGKKDNFTVQLKPGINIRDVGENAHTRVYKIIEKNPLYITSEVGDVLIASKLKSDFLLDEKYLTHTPGNYITEWGWRDEIEQSVYEPGVIELDVDIKKGEQKVLPFIISTRQDYDDMIYYNKLINDRSDIESKRAQLYSEPEISKMAQSMFSFTNKSHIGHGFFAGFPWFQNYWGRDSGHIMLAMTNLGMWDDVRKSLFTLAKHERDGDIPDTLFLSGVTNYNAIDDDPWFVIALDNYLRYSKDWDGVRDLLPVARRIVERGVNLLEDGLVPSASGQTWMDTLDRGGYCIDIQSVWAEAFMRAAEIVNKGYVKYANSIVKTINERFWKDRFFTDRIGDYSRRANVLFPLFFGQIRESKAHSALSILESNNFTSKAGIRSLASDDPVYNPRAYHNGNVWGVLTGMMCYSEFLYNRVRQGFKYLKIIKSNLGIRCINTLDEVYDGDTGFPLGCVSQAWSISPVIKTVDEMILGINPGIDDVINFEPRIFPDMKFERRSLRIGEDTIDISFSDGVFTIKGLKENNLKARTKYKVNVI